MRNPHILFVGWGGTDGVSHYRTILPARAMGAEWVVFDMDAKPVGGEGTTKNHEIIIIQNCWYDWQWNLVREMRKSGALVLFNVDDWIKGIKRIAGSHGNHKIFTDKRVIQNNKNIAKFADGVIASTPWLGDKLGKTGWSDNVAIARNGLDVGRYKPWTNVDRDMGIIIGWAGGTGHTEALRTISPAVSNVVKDYEEVSLWIVGQDERREFFCPSHHVPWTDLHLYPKNLACFDISLAPALDNGFYKAKSQLRLYEAMALHTPTLCHPMYDEVGDTGMVCEDTGGWETNLRTLIENELVREAMADATVEAVKDVCIENRVHEWVAAIKDLTGKDIAAVE